MLVVYGKSYDHELSNHGPIKIHHSARTISFATSQNQHPYDTSIAQIPNKSSSGQLQDIINISLPPVIPYSSYYHVDRNL